MSTRRAAGALPAVRRDLRRLPDLLRDGVEAACAVELARSIDAGVAVVASSKQLALLMAGLRARATAMRMAEAPLPRASEQAKESPVADLTSRIAARRGSSVG